MPICSIVSSLLGIWRSTRPKLPFSLNTLTRKRAISPNANPKSEPPRSRTCWMCSSEVMLRISSSVSSGPNVGPSTRCKIPCTRITGGVPTRMCRSEAPSETTNCNKSDIEYDMLKSYALQARILLPKLDSREALLSRAGVKSLDFPQRR
ncbi:hypothetical protein SBV1_1520010 [Verrucomicrobia bacterium]|nr:hypothetical protein SBV1_1520010 [Verrucomicrobiota bacterium]